jgi:integrase
MGGMASVHKTSKSRFWHGSIWVGGKQIFRSTGETDKARALAVALAWEGAANGPRPESPGQARKVMEELLAGVLGRDRGRARCGEYLERWLAAMEGTVEPGTLTFYRGAAGAFVREIGPEREVGGVTAEEVVGWRTAEAGRVSVTTANHRLKAVRAYFAAAVRDGYARTNPAEGIKPLKKSREKGKRRPFTRGEIALVLGVCNADWRMVVRLGLATGQRLGDLVRMDWLDVDLAHGVWMVRTGKTGARLVLPLLPDLVRDLKARRGAGRSGSVFPALLARLGKKGEVNWLSNAFADILWRAGLRTTSPHDRLAKNGRKAALVAAGGDRREQQELSFHSIRHTARTWLEEAGQPRAIIDALIGHSGETGRRYTRVGIDALRAAAEVLGGNANAPAD